MTPSAIYSKSGKGVQEASGKTSLLSRSDRAVLSAFDGRITVKEVAERVGKPFDGKFEQIIRQLERDGYVREVSHEAAAARPATGKAGAAPAAGSADELDFTTAIPATPRPSAPPDLAAKARAEAERKAKEEQANSYKARQEAEAKKQAEAKAAEAKAAALARAAAKAVRQPAPQDEARAEAARKLNLELPVFSKPAAFDPDATARMQATAFAKAREEAEEKAQKERDRIKAEAEAKLRAETESKMRAEAEEVERAEYARMAEADAKRKESEAKIQAAREEAVRAAFEAERAQAKEEAERARQAREEAERARKEAEEKARKEQERLVRVEAERKAREEQERQAKEEAARKAREETERKAKEEQARKAREEAEREAREESERKAREDRERKVREEAEGKAKEEAQRAEREAEQALKEVERAQRDANEKAEQEAKAPEKAKKPVPAATGDSFADSLLADLDSFTQREDEEIKAKEEAIRKEKDEAARRVTAKAEAERKAKDDAEREKREEEEGRRREEEARRAREEQERAAREVDERASREAEERRRAQREAQMEKEAAALAKAGADDIVVTDADLDMDDVKRDEAAISKEARERDKKAAREREREAKEREKEAKELARERKREAKRAASAPAAGAVAYAPIRRRRNWGKPVAITLLLLLAAGIGLLHVIPIATDEYEKAASEATGRPVKISSAHLSLYNGVLLKLDGVSIGDVKIASVRAYPEIGSLLDDKKAFSRVELDGVSLPLQRIGEVLGAKVKSDKFSVARVNARHLKLVGVLEFPELEADLLLDRDGSVRSADLRGVDGLAARLTPKGSNVEFDVTANSFTLPIAPEVTLTAFAMKGVATPDAMRIDSWGGGNLDGAVSGNATVRWGSNWNIEGALTVRGINGAVFAPALLSEGKVEGSGRFSVNGPDPKRFMERGHLEGTFTVHKGVLGSVDLSRAIQTGGRQAEGRTPFTGLSAQGLFDKGAISLRDVAFNAGALNAGASADIASNGALSGRIIADIRTSSQTLRATVNLGGTVKEPQVKN